MSGRKLLLAWVGVVVSLSIVGCGGGTKITSTFPGTVSVQATAASSTVDGGDSTTVTAIVTDDHNSAGVTWSVTGPGVLTGNGTTSVTYTAPAATSSSQSATVTATSIADNTKTSQAVITIPAALTIASLTTVQQSVAVGTPYTAALSASGGIPPYKSWVVSSGTLPSCLNLNSSTGVLSSPSTPTGACVGVYSGIKFSVSDSGTATAETATTSAQTITVTGPSIVFPTTLASGAVGIAYSASAAATGTVGTTTYSISSGALPASGDLSFNASTGAITGTPKAADVGTFTIHVSVSDQFGDTATSGALSLTIVAAPAITFGAAPTGTAKVSTAYASAVTATGGVGTLTFSKASGNLPPSLTLGSNGSIQGTPAIADIGTWTFAVKASDAFGDSATSVNYTISVSSVQLIITTASPLPSGYGSVLYSQAFAASGGTGTGFTWIVTSGGSSLTALNLSLSSGGVLSGTPPVAGGSASFTVQVMDSGSNTASLPFTLTISPGITITTGTTLPTGFGSSPYSKTLAATGGSGTGYTWSVLTGGSSLTALNLSLSSAGVLSGTPPSAGGTASFTVKVTDSLGNTATATFSLTVNSSITVTVPTLAAAYPGAAYTSPAFTASGGSGTGYTWTMIAGTGSSVPATFTINSSTGVISATSPVNSGTGSATYAVVVSATDSVGNKGSANVTLTIEATVKISTAATLPGGTTGSSYSQQLAATGGSLSYTWQLTGANDVANLGALGLSLNGATGVLSGLSPNGGTASFTATATDTQGHVPPPVTFSVTVTNVIKINQTTLPSGDKSSPYTTTLTASGGTGTGYNFFDNTGTLAGFGLTMAVNGTISGTPTVVGTVTFTAKVTDSANNSGTQSLSIQINNALSLSAFNSLPSGFINTAYSGSIVGTGGSGSLSMAITTPLAPANGTLTASVASNAVNITGTPVNVSGESIGITLTDTQTGASITVMYSFSVNNQSSPTLPVGTPPGGVVGQSYSDTITASGGVGPFYTWFVNGTTVNSPFLSLGNGMIVSTTGDNHLLIGGTPTSTGSITISVQVRDNTTNLTSNAQDYTINISITGNQISGSIMLGNSCGTVTPPTFSVALVNTANTFSQTISTDSSGNFNFTSVPNDTYTVTPSYSGPVGSSSIFYPASQSVTMTGGNQLLLTTQVALGYTVSGTVSYGASHTGQIYLNLLNNSCTNNGGSGTSVSSTGSYTIHGVPPGSYTLSAWMDSTDLSLGQGIPNTSDPAGTAAVTVASSNVSSANVTITNNDPGSAPTATPTIQGGYRTHNGVVFSYSPATDSNNNEVATSYDVAWSVSPSLTSGVLSTIAGTFNYTANGQGTIWVLNNGITGATSFVDGTTYYFMARANNAAGHGPWSVYGGSGPIGVTVGPASGNYTVSGNVTIPAGVTVSPNAKLYVGFFSQSSGIYATIVASPAVGSNNPFSIDVPNTVTNSWQFFGILDQNNDGQINTGDISNTRSTQGGPPTVSITSSQTLNLSLVNINMLSLVQTQYFNNTTSTGTNSNYALVLGGGPATKLPVSMTLTAASNPNVIVPIDISEYCQGCGQVQFQSNQNINTDTPAVGDTYTFTVHYSDGTSDSNVTASVTGWNGSGAVPGPTSIATSMLPNGATGPATGTRTQPDFSWAYPSGASTAGDYYTFTLCCSSNSNIWQIPSPASNLSGFLYSEVPAALISWDVDPIGSQSSTTVTNLTVGTNYTWTLTANDANGNQASTTTWYQP